MNISVCAVLYGLKYGEVLMISLKSPVLSVGERHNSYSTPCLYSLRGAVSRPLTEVDS